MKKDRQTNKPAAKGSIALRQGDTGAGAGKRKVPPPVIMILLLIAVYFISIVFCIRPTEFGMSLAAYRTMVQSNLTGLLYVFLGRAMETTMLLLVKKYLMIVLVGAALAAAGAMYKTIFRNTLAAPTTMGVQEGGLLGNLLFIALFGGAAALDGAEVNLGTFAKAISDTVIFETFGVDLFIFAGCFVGCILVMVIATTAGGGHLSSATLVLAGTVVNGAIAGITGAMQYNVTMSSGDDDLIRWLQHMAMGTFDYLYFNRQILIMLAVFVPCFVIMFVLSGAMNLYALGDEEAMAAGVRVRALRAAVILMGVIMTGLTMVFCGHIAFIGFIVPQIISRAAGPDFRKNLLYSILVGGVVTLLVYDFGYIFGMTDGLSLITTIIGTIMMMWVLLNKKERQHAVT